MIKVIDKVKYLRPNKKDFIDLNTPINENFKGLIKDVERKLKNKFGSHKSTCTITISGSIEKNTVSFGFDGDDEEFLEKVDRETKRLMK